MKQFDEAKIIKKNNLENNLDNEQISSFINSIDDNKKNSIDFSRELNDSQNIDLNNNKINNEEMIEEVLPITGDCEQINLDERTKNILKNDFQQIHKQEIETKDNKQKRKRKKETKQEQVENINEKNIDMPIFNVEKENGKIIFNNINRQKVNNFNYNNRPQTFTTDMSPEQLRIIKINTTKAINEIKLDISVLNSLLDPQNEYYEYYLNKLTYLQNELIFLNQRKIIIERLLKNKI